MYATIKRLYAKTGDKSVVRKAVVRGQRLKEGWITAAQYTEITGEAY